MASPHMQEYDDFYNSARYENSLPGQTTPLIHLAVALALGCEP